MPLTNPILKTIPLGLTRLSKGACKAAFHCLHMGFDPTQILIDDGELPDLYLALSQRDFEKAAKLISDGATLDDGRDYIEIATTRPETMLADMAVAVHPSDERSRA